jgi:hypothetical protein
MIVFLKRLWQGWKKIAAKIAHVQGHILLGVIYILIVTPLGLLFRLFRQDPLSIRFLKRPSFWVRRPPITSTEAFLKKEF